MIRAAPISHSKVQVTSKVNDQDQNVLAIANQILQELHFATSTEPNIIQKTATYTANYPDYIGYIPVITYLNNFQWNGFEDLMNFHNRRQVANSYIETEGYLFVVVFAL